MRAKLLIGVLASLALCACTTPSSSDRIPASEESQAVCRPHHLGGDTYECTVQEVEALGGGIGRFTVSREILTSAFDAYCSRASGLRRRCDALSNYDWSVAADQPFLKVWFLHRTARRGAFALDIRCTANNGVWECIGDDDFERGEFR